MFENGDRRPGLFFIIGPLRTGSSLLTRCIDDHPESICLCESEINRALFPGYVVLYHSWRMMAHGLKQSEAIGLLDRKKQDDIGSIIKWYSDVVPRLSDLYGKENVTKLGDKSPDLFRCPELVRYLSSNFPLIYTVRDPRAIFCSIEYQSNVSADEKKHRWESLVQNYLAWKPHLTSPNMLILRYEDLIVDPPMTMEAVYNHLGLRRSRRFLMPFQRAYPERFLWATAVDWETGIRKEFDPNRITSWKTKLTADQLNCIHSDEIVLEFMERFDYPVDL